MGVIITRYSQLKLYKECYRIKKIIVKMRNIMVYMC